MNTISSYPVLLCFCRDNIPDCNYQPETVHIDKRNPFFIELIAYNQSLNVVDGSIYTSRNSSAGGLNEGQQIQNVNEACTKLTFTLFSPHNVEELTLSVEGPRNVSGTSKQHVLVKSICTCPIGFQVSNNDQDSCDCVCNSVLQANQKTECDAKSQSIIRKDNFWITYINKTNGSGYLIYPICPYDYCHLPEEHISINLNIHNGSNIIQCSSHHSGILCGSCTMSYSLSLGSSSCLHCPAHWLSLLVTIVIVFVISGISLIALLLVLNYSCNRDT